MRDSSQKSFLGLCHGLHCDLFLEGGSQLYGYGNCPYRRKKLFEMALPIAVWNDEDSQVNEAIITMRQRHGQDWLISRYA
jgi:hypothetical protein